MAVIDIGYGADEAPVGNLPGGWTTIDGNNPANASGTLTSFSVYFNVNQTGVKCGTFSGPVGQDFTYRDHAVIGNVSGGSKQTFNGLSIDVETNDCLGYMAAEDYGATKSGGTARYHWAGNAFSAGTHTYDLTTVSHLCAYATGVTAGWPHIGALDGVTQAAQILTLDGVTLAANVKAINGQDV